ncbi:heat shock factor protein 4 [Brienomyrus brachyistius]|uniref:heat shock factor protein 4 n=1 Tax=Brienomyrus brachyistius TaxID=42636 RepID=UPI0020B32837|nr:heat shock factor protein 4 [Brienomyrus brachyistius]
MQESPGSVAMDGSYSSNVPAFLTKLWTLVEDPETSHLICWSTTGTSFHVFDQGRFAKEVLPKYFKHSNMASFVRQLNMYGFRKVVNIEQSGLVKPERDDTEFQHLYFLQGHEHLLEHIKRKVSIVKSEEARVRQEDLSKLLYEVQVLRNQQESMQCQMQDVTHQNEVLWGEVMSLRQNFTQQQKVMNKLIQFLFTQMQSNLPNSVAMKRKLPLMLDDGPSSPPASKFGHNLLMEPLQEPYYIHSPSNPIRQGKPNQSEGKTPSGTSSIFNTTCFLEPSAETGQCSGQGLLAGGPIISDVTEMSQSSAMNMPGEQLRGTCQMLIKAEPMSPGVHARGTGIPFADPPVLPVAMVQSILEGHGPGVGEKRGRRQLERSEIQNGVESMDMRLEELQLLLRMHQQGVDPTGTVDPFNSNLPLSEWNFTDIEANLKSYMFQHQDPDMFSSGGCEGQ